MINWENGQFDIIMSECRAIQKNLKTAKRLHSSEYIAKTFAKHILQGRVNSALRRLEKSESSGVLPLTSNMLNDLISKHPIAKPADPKALLDGDIPFVDPAQFNMIDEALIAQAAMRTRGSYGPSGADAKKKA